VSRVKVGGKITVSLIKTRIIGKMRGEIRNEEGEHRWEVVMPRSFKKKVERGKWAKGGRVTQRGKI